MTGIVWLASYLKSGNTWLRLALSSLRAQGSSVDINRIGGDEDSISSSRRHFDILLDIDSSDLTFDEVQAARPDVFRALARTLKEPAFWKVHEMCSETVDGAPLFPADATVGVVYIVRDPRDLAISLSHHFSTSIDDAIAIMGDADFTVGNSSKGLPRQLPQRVGSWSGNVGSWLDHGPCTPLLIRYEDMLADMASNLRRVAEMARLKCSEEAIRGAVHATRFTALRAQEEANGFRERPPGMSRFFRSGKTGEWKEVLRREQVARIERDHGHVMARLGYF